MTRSSVPPLRIVAGSVTLPKLLPVVLALFAAGDAIGVDERPRFRPLLAMAARAEGLSLDALGLSVEALLRPSREELIAALYDELAELAAAVAVEPSYRADYDAKLAELRALQEAEAEELHAAFEARGALDEAALDAAIRDARALLGETDAEPPGSHEPA